MAGKDRSFARRSVAGAAFSPPLEIDALERAAAGIRPSWAPAADGALARRSGIERAAERDAAFQGACPAVAPLAPTPSGESGRRTAVRAEPGLGPDDTTEIDFVLPGSRRALRKVIAVAALALGAGLALLFVPTSQPRPQVTTNAEPARPASAPPPAPRAAQPGAASLRTQSAAEPPRAPVRADGPAPTAPAAASAPPRAATIPAARAALPRAAADAPLTRTGKRQAPSGAAAPPAKSAKKAGAQPKARAKRARPRASTPPAHLKAGYINDNPY